MLYKKEIAINAIQWDGTNLEEVKSFVGDLLKYEIYDAAWKLGIAAPKVSLSIKIDNEYINISNGDYIIKDEYENFGICDPNTFEKTYTKIKEAPKVVKKLFISQPMNGKSDKEILADRDNAIANAKKILGENIEVIVIDSFFQNVPDGVKPLWFLGKSIELLSDADVAYFVSGWEEARGCRLEHNCAEQYGIEILEDKDA